MKFYLNWIPGSFNPINEVFFWDEFMTTSFSRFTGFHSDLGLGHFGPKIALRKLDSIWFVFLSFLGQLIEGRGMLGFKYLGQLGRLGQQHFGFIARYRAILKSRSLMFCFSSRNGRFRVISSSLYCASELAAYCLLVLLAHRCQVYGFGLKWSPLLGK